MYGADLVGIAPYDERWIYSSQVCVPTTMSGEVIKEKANLHQEIDFGFEPKSVIVFAVEMDYETITEYGIYINSDALAAMGITVPQEIADRAIESTAE